MLSVSLTAWRCLSLQASRVSGFWGGLFIGGIVASPIEAFHFPYNLPFLPKPLAVRGAKRREDEDGASWSLWVSALAAVMGKKGREQSKKTPPHGKRGARRHAQASRDHIVLVQSMLDKTNSGFDRYS